MRGGDRASLAERFAQMGEHRGGNILALYTYDGNAYNPGSMARIELRPAVIPE